jgi:hypothetical protein
MTDPTAWDDLEPEDRDALASLAGPDGGAADEDVVERARAACDALAGGHGDVAPADRARIGDYLLGRQSPGRAAGTWGLLESDDAAAAWAGRLRDGLGGLLGDDPPSLPADDGARSPTDLSRLDDETVRAEERTLAARREERDRQRTAANAKAAAAELMSPFRGEALEAQRTAQDHAELPDFAPRPVRFAMYVLVAALVVGLGFAIFVRVPVNTNATVLVTRVPESAPGSEEGIELLVLLPDISGAAKDAPSGADVRVGDTLRVALPGQDQRQSVKLRSVSGDRRSPREVIQQFRLPLGQANRVTGPGYVAIAPIRPPAGRTRRSYEGTATTEASVQTGTQRIISLLF